MFGFFKKKKGSFGDAQAHEVLSKTAAMLEMQLMLCKAQKDKYDNFLHSKFVRGYLIGFFDAALQHANIPVNDDNHFFLLISVGHTYLFQGNPDEGGNYALDSLALKGAEEFEQGQGQGGAEYFNFINGKIRSPMGLSARFHGIDLANA